MIKIAKTQEEFVRINEFASQNGFQDVYSKVIVYEEQNGKIVGVVGVDNPYIIEPLIGKSAFISNNLYHVAYGMILPSGVDRIECYTTDEQYKIVAQYFEKQDFQFLEKTNRFVKLLKEN